MVEQSTVDVEEDETDDESAEKDGRSTNVRRERTLEYRNGALSSFVGLIGSTRVQITTKGAQMQQARGLRPGLQKRLGVIPTSAST